MLGRPCFPVFSRPPLDEAEVEVEVEVEAKTPVPDRSGDVAKGEDQQPSDPRRSAA